MRIINIKVTLVFLGSIFWSCQDVSKHLRSGNKTSCEEETYINCSYRYRKPITGGLAASSLAPGIWMTYQLIEKNLSLGTEIGYGIGASILLLTGGICLFCGIFSSSNNAELCLCNCCAKICGDTCCLKDRRPIYQQKLKNLETVNIIEGE